MKLDRDLITPYQRIGVACSGGRDSMALLHALTVSGADCCALHVNHALRPTADRDEALVRDYCNTHGITLHVWHAAPDEIGSSNVENAARNFRLACYRDAVKQGLCDVVATAHHALDNAETVLLHLFRGAGPQGLGGIPRRTELLIRPMLDCTRDEIDAYIAAHGIPYCTDETNLSTDYDRNFLRNTVFPLLQTRWSDVAAAINRASTAVRCEHDYLDQLTPTPVLKDGEVRLEGLEDLPQALALHYAYRGAKLLVPCDVERKHLITLLTLFTRQNGTTVDLPHGLRAVNDYGVVTLYLASSPDTLCEPWRKESHTVDGYRVTLGQDPTIPPRPTLCFDADAVPNGAVWRRRRPGDTFTPYGGGTRSLKEYLIDAKVSSRLRDKLVLLCYNNEVLVVAGVEISRKVQIHKGSRLIATIGYENG